MGARAFIFWGALGLCALRGEQAPQVDFSPDASRVIAPARLPALDPPRNDPEKPRLENEFFYVQAPDNLSLRALWTLAGEVKSVYDGFIPAARWQRPVMVEAVPAETLKHKPARGYWVEMSEHGYVSVFFAWDESLPIEYACEGLSFAYFKQLVAHYRGVEKARDLPFWFALALGRHALHTLQNGMEDWSVQASQNAELTPLSDLLAGKVGKSPEHFALDAYWLFRVLLEEAPLREVFRDWVAAFAQEGTRQTLERCLPRWAELSPEERELWWAVRRENLVRRATYRGQTLEETRRMLAEVSLFPLEKEGEKRALSTVEALWEYRKDPGVKSIALDRLKYLRERIGAANAVYFNAVHSFGACLEALIAEREGDFRRAYARFEDDLRRAQALEQSVRAVLDAPPDWGAPAGKSIQKTDTPSAAPAVLQSR